MLGVRLLVPSSGLGAAGVSFAVPTPPVQAGSEAAKLLRQARARLNKVQIQGHSDVQKFLRKSRRQISKGLTSAERTVRPKRKTTARKKVARKAGTRA